VVAAASSAPVSTASTPGMASAGAASIDNRRAHGCGLATSATCFMPASAMSATKRPLPVTKRRSSLGRRLRAM
jgi:hypothetical protein